MRMRALEALGHSVVPLDTESLAARQKRPGILQRLAYKLGYPLNIADVNRQLLAIVRQHRPDIVWIDKGLFIWPETLAGMRGWKPPVRLVGFSPDDMGRKHNQSTYFLKGLPLYDVFFTTKTFNVSELRALGAAHPVFVGNGFDPETHKPVSVTSEDRKRLGGPVGFIGAWEEDRGHQMLALAEAGIGVRVWGWQPPINFRKYRHKNLLIEGKPLWGLDYARCICSFDINLGFLRKINRDRQTTRSVEIPACSAFMLAERTDEHLQLFEEGKEAEFFGSIEELIDKCRFYLAHEEIRKKIAAAGRTRCLKSGYSNHYRMEMMLRQVAGLGQSGC